MARLCPFYLYRFILNQIRQTRAHRDYLRYSLSDILSVTGLTNPAVVDVKSNVLVLIVDKLRKGDRMDYNQLLQDIACTKAPQTTPRGRAKELHELECVLEEERGRRIVDLQY